MSVRCLAAALGISMALGATSPATAQGEPAWWTQEKIRCGLDSGLAYNSWDGHCAADEAGGDAQGGGDFLGGLALAAAYIVGAVVAVPAFVIAPCHVVDIFTEAPLCGSDTGEFASEYAHVATLDFDGARIRGLADSLSDTLASVRATPDFQSFQPMPPRQPTPLWVSCDQARALLPTNLGGRLGAFTSTQDYERRCIVPRALRSTFSCTRVRPNGTCPAAGLPDNQCPEVVQVNTQNYGRRATYNVTPELANAYSRMEEAAARAGVALEVHEGFRTNEDQHRFYRCMAAGEDVGETRRCRPHAPAECRGVCSRAFRPGTSQHERAVGIDLNHSADVTSWLVVHAREYGFRNPGYPGEPWHWEWDERTLPPGDDACGSGVAAGSPAPPAEPPAPVRVEVAAVPSVAAMSAAYVAATDVPPPGAALVDLASASASPRVESALTRARAAAMERVEPVLDWMAQRPELGSHVVSAVSIFTLGRDLQRQARATIGRWSEFALCAADTSGSSSMADGSSCEGWSSLQESAAGYWRLVYDRLSGGLEMEDLGARWRGQREP